MRYCLFSSPSTILAGFSWRSPLSQKRVLFKSIASYAVLPIIVYTTNLSALQLPIYRIIRLPVDEKSVQSSAAKQASIKWEIAWLRTRRIIGGTRKPLTLFSTTSLQPGESVVMIGNPMDAASNKTRGIPSREAEDEDKLLYVVNYAWLKFPP